MDRVRQDIAKRREEGVSGPLPADLVTASGSGLDPDLSPEAALAQAGRIARIRELPVGTIRNLVKNHVDGPLLGIFGEDRVNILALNQALDRLGTGTPP